MVRHHEALRGVDQPGVVVPRRREAGAPLLRGVLVVSAAEVRDVRRLKYRRIAPQNCAAYR